MYYFKRPVVSLLCLGFAYGAFASDEPTQAEIEALKSTHKQFEGLMLDGQSAYEASKHYLDGIAKEPTETPLSKKYPGSVIFTKEDAKIFREQDKVVKELVNKEEQRPEWTRDVSEYDALVQSIANSGRTKVEKRIAALYPDAKDKDVELVRGNSGKSSLLKDNEDLYYFITSGMDEQNIIDILVQAKRVGATVVIRGMLPNTKSLIDTSKWFMELFNKAEITVPPRVITDPRLFNAYNIKMAPAMVYMRGDVEVVALGSASPEWIVEIGREESGYKDLGNISQTVEIVEEDIIELLQRKYAEIDWKEQRKIAVKNYFAKLTFPTMPVPQEDSDYELDPRIVFTKDVYAGTKLMARKGDVVNPLLGFEGVKHSLFIIDPRDERQKSLVKDRLWKDNKGNPIVIVSHLDAKKQFDGISELQQELDSRIYMMQPAYIDRFKITNLPIRVDIIGGKGIWIHEYGVETLEQIHEKLTGETN